MLRALVLCTLIAAASLAPLSTGSPAFAPCVNGLAARRRPVRLLACAQSREVIREGEVEFDPRDCFYRPHSAVVRDLGVLALRHFCREDSQPAPRVLDAMCGSGIRALRYIREGGAAFVLANDANDDLVAGAQVRSTRA
jgi:tRNA (guanine26-N2/guanine27-N2)-dimethyltransferase